LLLAYLISFCSAQCSVCELVVSFTEKWVANNATEAEILGELDTFCNGLPFLGQQCASVVNEYGPQAIAWIVKNENPQAFCTQIGVCSSNVVKTQQNRVHKLAEEQSGGCGICQLVMTAIDTWLESNQTEAEIAAQLDVLCNALGPLASECNSLVATYLPQMIAWVEKNENPTAFCTQIGLCTSQKKFKPKPIVRERRDESAEEQGAACQICQVVMGYVEQFVAQNNTIAEMETALDSFCNALPSPLSSMCTSLVNQYLPQMVAWIVKKEAPAAFCTQVGLCSSGKVLHLNNKVN